MTRLMNAPMPPATRPAARDREAMSMLLHEALARSRQREAEEAARRYRLVRSATAQRGRSFELLGALFRRSARARAAAARRAACRALIG